MFTLFYWLLAGYPASLGFPPSLTASLWYFLKLYNVFNDNVVDPLNLMGLRRQADRQHYVISRHLWRHRTSSGSF